MRRLSYFLILVVFFLCMGSGVSAQSKPFEGEVLNISTMDGKPLDTIKLVVPIFEEKTGARVVIDSAYATDAHAKAMLSMTTGAGAYDIVLISSEWVGAIRPYLETLDDYIAKDPDSNVDDFAPFVKQSFTDEDGHWFGFPYRFNSFALAYRTDIFEDYEINPADVETMTGFRETAKKLTLDTTGDGKIDTWGVSLIGDPKAVYFFVTPFIWSYGIDFFDKDWKPLTNDPKFVAAVENYVELFDYAVPGSRTFSDDEALTAMQQGKAAMCITESPYIVRMADQDQSVVWDKISILPLPLEEPGAVANLMGCFGHGIPKDSKKKELAWEFLKFLSSSESNFEMTKAFGNLPWRLSLFEEPAVAEYIPGYDMWKELLKSGKSFFVLPESSEFFFIFAEELSNAVNRIKSPKEACDDLTERAYKLMEEAGYYSK